MMKGVLLYTVCATLDNGIYVPIRYIILKERLRTPFWVAMTINALVILIEGISLFYIDKATGQSVSVDMARMWFSVAYPVISLLTINDRWQKVLFLVLMYIPVAFFGIGLSSYITKYVLIVNDSMDLLLMQDILRICYVVVSSYPAYAVIMKYLKPAGELDGIGIWRAMWVIPLSFSIVDFLTVEYFLPPNEDLFQLFIRFSCLAGCVTACVGVAEALKSEARRSREKMISERSEQLLNMVKDQYQDLTAYVGELRKVKHDARHHLRVMKSLALGGNTNELVKYITDMDESVKTPDVFTVSENFAVNAIVGSYAAAAREKGIDVRLKVQIPEHIGINEIDLCVIIGNCMENSIEAQEYVEGEKYITVRAKCFENKVYFVIENSFDGRVEQSNDAFLSRKLKFKREGIGLVSVKDIVTKYNGEYKITVSKEKKQFLILLMLEQKCGAARHAGLGERAWMEDDADAEELEE